MLIEIDFDTAKDERNTAERGISFKLAAQFDFSTAWIVEDTRQSYPERRFQALGLLGDRLHMLVFTPIPGGIRVISFRKANKREVRSYAQTTRP